jgi:hypothetical protein
VTESDLRRLERAFRASGSVEDEAAWLMARVQAGELDRGVLELAAYCGHEAANTLHRVDVPEAVDALIEGLAPWASEELWRRTALALLDGVRPGDADLPEVERVVRLLEDDASCRCESHWAELASLPNPAYPADPAGRAYARAVRYAANAAKAAEEEEVLGALREVARTVAGALGDDPAQALRELLRRGLVPWALGRGDR